MDDPKVWKRFVRWLAGGLGGTLGLCAIVIVVTDPYGNIPFAPPGERPIMDINQRWMYPALARSPKMDSAVFGTSSIRLIEPSHLDSRFGGAFAQMAMNSATAWEQMQIADLFLRHHPNPRTIIVGIDGTWCGNRPAERITSRGFPEWMYDDNPWNDLLYLMNGKTIEISGRMIGHVLAGQAPSYDKRGWANFLPSAQEYDLAKARTNIYGSPEPRIHAAPSEPPPSPEMRQGWSYPDQGMLADFLAKVPDETRTILAFVPYHTNILGHPLSATRAGLEECKGRITDIARRRGTVHVVDFMIESPMTATDENYWDTFHYGLPTAQRIVDLMAEGVLNGHASTTEMRILVRH